MNMNDKVVVITGTGTGVGRACMQIFAARGAQVVGAGRTAATLAESAQQVVDHGGDARVVQADVSQEAGAEAVIADALQTHGRIDALIHAAGVGYSWTDHRPESMNDAMSTPPTQWREVIDINLNSYYLMVRAVLPHMIAAGGGAIVAVASISGQLGLPAAHAYTAAKAGMINLTRSLCVRHARDGIRANCVAPGFIATPMVASLLPLFDDPATAEQLSPMRRPGTPEEMAKGCLYLASDDASYCNGTVLVIDGGTSARQ
ncbi:SDR family NAD(P)-dependent oxidoreductase [Panacagrimonas sp.]|uniref:SDR family NAD(P)-dependent oxidoreductase n=1 Tax=Panacagrimonas sp. TaxID=2480088 RepID=UPI003B52A486